MIANGKRVLHVDEMEAVRRRLADVFGEDGFLVVEAQDGIQTLWEMEHRHLHAVVTDDHVAFLDGLDLLRQC